jgi:geranylgeranyl reductase family protein
MTTCDVAIIGGGPAGSTCAWQLRRAGADVVLWDRRHFPRDKVCAGWITPEVFAELEIDPTDYAGDDRTLQPIRGFAVSRLGDTEARVRYDHPVSYGIRRCEFDTYLLRRSRAQLRLGEPVRLTRVDGEWVLNGVVRAKMLVGAGGHFCPVAQSLGARLGAGEPIVAAQETELELTPVQQRTCNVAPDLPEIYFTRDLRGYGWVFRKGGYINIGLGRQDTHRLGNHVDDFLAFLARRRKIPSELSAKLKGHPYLLYGQAPRPLIDDGVLLIGDAAGLAYPKSGEGIRPAIESGILAARTILAAQGCYDRAHLEPYQRAVVDRFGSRQGGRGVTDLVPPPLLGAIAGRLFGTDWFARHVVLNRWFFHTRDAPLKGFQTAPVIGPLGSGPSQAGHVSAAG